MYDDGDEVVESVRVEGVVGSVEEAQFEWEDDAMREFRVTVKLFYVLEAFQMQRQYRRQFFHAHAFLSLLLGMTHFAVVFLLQAKRF